MNPNEEIALELRRQFPRQYEELRGVVDRRKRSASENGPPRLWVARLVQEEPVLAATISSAFDIATDEIAWEDNRLPDHLEVTPMSNLSDFGDSIPWGEEGDMTCRELVEEVGA